MKNYIKDELGFETLLPINPKDNEFIAITVKGRCYENQYSVFKVKFDSNIYKNMFPKVLNESHEISFSKKGDALKTGTYIQSKKLI